MTYCTDLTGLEFSSRLTKKKCGYCKSGKERYGVGSLLPAGFCPDAYYAAYPYFLALLYDARIAEFGSGKEVEVNCPAPQDPSILKVHFRNKKLKPLLNILEKAFRALGMPKDAIDKVMMVEVVHAGANCRLKEKQSIEIKVPDTHQLCPASYFSVYPLAFLSAKGHCKAIKFSCPDPETCIEYASQGAAGPVDECCVYLPDISKYKLVAQENSGCVLREWQGQAIGLEKIMPQGLCLFVLNISIPYLITLRNGGYFKWRKEKSSVKASCPRSYLPVAFKVSSAGAAEENTSILITGAQDCPVNHFPGQEFKLDLSKMICPHLSVRLFPYLLLMEQEADKHREGMEISCSLSRCRAKFLLARK